MSNPLPGLRGTSTQVLYPFTKSIAFRTEVITFMGGQEQRHPHTPPLYRFALSMNTLSDAERAAYVTYMGTAKGKFGQNLTLSLGATTYSNLALEQDDLAFTTRMPLLYDQQISLRQVQNGAWTPPTPLSSFPTLSAGVVAELPFEDHTEYLTNTNENPNGPRYAYAFYNAGAGANFPSTPLKRWKLSYPVLTNADQATLENAFLGWMGRNLSFSFTNPVNNVTYTHVRCDYDELQFHGITKNEWSAELMLRQTNGS